MIQFSFNGENFNYIPIEDLTPDDIPDAHPYNNGKVGYMGIECAFDIETSRITEDFSTMYLWGFALGDVTIIGRTWEQFDKLRKMVSEKYDLVNSKCKLLCWIHNMPYEMSFLRKRLRYAKNRFGNPDCFLLDDRKPIYVCTDENIEFRDSYILTRRPLKDLPKVYGLSIQKLVGELDYSKIRNCETKLEPGEIAYQINDVQVLAKWHKKYIVNEFFRKNIHLPLTSTGIVRDELKRNFKALPKAEREAWRRKLRKCFPSEELYKVMIEWLFRGGYTHANIEVVDEVLNLLDGWDLSSDDIKSSYPAVLLQEKFPMMFVEKPVDWFFQHADDKKYTKRFAFWGVFQITGIRSRTSHHIESENKIYAYDKAVFDNGRLIRTEKDGFITVCLNEFDYESYKMMYEWDYIECLNLYVADKEELPTYVKDLILKFFYLKETLVKDTTDYVLSKGNLNSIYGMMVTALLNSMISYDEDGEIQNNGDIPYQKAIARQILLPQWGIWCTSMARNRLLTCVYKCTQNAPMSVLYCDTDSIKNGRAMANRWIFDTFNDRIKRINRTMYTGTYDRSIYRNLGCYENEGKSFRFKTLGAKRYIHTDIVKDKKTKMYHLGTTVTIAGLVKGSLQKYCKDKGLDIYEAFQDGMDLDEEYSEKLGSTYTDEEVTMDVTDYTGHTATHTELSCVTLNPISFSMAMESFFLSLVEEQKRLNARRFAERKW